MPEKIIINTENEEHALIPDKWVLGTGLSTDGLYVVHTATPFMIVQYPLNTEENAEQPSCTVYMKGKADSDTFNRLFAEAWEIVEIYKDRLRTLGADLRIIQ